MADLPLDQLPEKVSPEAEDLLYLVDSGAPPGTGDAKVKVGSLPQPVTDHGALTGLTDDDHPQYHTDARGDARYDALGSAAAAEAAAAAELVNHEAALDPHAAAAYLQSVVAGTNVTVDDTDPRNPVVSATGGETDHGALTGLADNDHLQYLQSVVAGTNVSVDASDPQNPVVSATGGGGETDHGALTGLADNDHLQYLQSVVAGTGISVDGTDPQNPVVSATGGAGGSRVIAEHTFDGVETEFIVDVSAYDDVELLVFGKSATLNLQVSSDGGNTWKNSYYSNISYARNGGSQSGSGTFESIYLIWAGGSGLYGSMGRGTLGGLKAGEGVVYTGLWVEYTGTYYYSGSVSSVLQEDQSTQDQITHIRFVDRTIGNAVAAGNRVLVLDPKTQESGIQEGADNEVAGVKVSVVAALPGTPDADTLYFVTG